MCIQVLKCTRSMFKRKMSVINSQVSPPPSPRSTGPRRHEFACDVQCNNCKDSSAAVKVRERRAAPSDTKNTQTLLKKAARRKKKKEKKHEKLKSLILFFQFFEVTRRFFTIIIIIIIKPPVASFFIIRFSIPLNRVLG